MVNHKSKGCITSIGRVRPKDSELGPALGRYAISGKAAE
jgi:hypothetical protein